MLLTVNNQPLTLPQAPNLAGLTGHLGLTSRPGIAIAVNQQIIPKSAWSDYVLHENDQVTIIHATQGG